MAAFARALRVTAWAAMCGAIFVAGSPVAADASTRPAVAAYTIAPAPIAPTGSLGTTGSVQLMLTVLDATGKPIPGGLVWLKYVSVMPDGHVRPWEMGVFTVVATPIKISKSSYLYRAGLAGTLTLTYTASTNGTPRYTDEVLAYRFFNFTGP